jgi:hypothetical protein
MTSRLIPKRIRVAVLPRLRWLHRLGLRLDVLKVLLGQRDRVVVPMHVQAHLPIRPHLRDLGREPAHVAFGGFSISHHGYLGREAQEARI